VSPSGRTPSGYRLYDESSVHRLRFIKNAQRSGLRLREIRELLQVMDQGACPCGHTTHLVGQRIQQVDEELGRLQAQRAELMRLQERNQSSLAATPEVWFCAVAQLTKGGDPS
jgi:DNA-binding transcriptional MerR regulator